MSGKKVRGAKYKVIRKNDRGLLGLVHDQMYHGVKFCESGGMVSKDFPYPQKIAEKEWLKWLDDAPTEEELCRAEPSNRGERRAAGLCERRNANLRVDHIGAQGVSGKPDGEARQIGGPCSEESPKEYEKERETMDEKRNETNEKQPKCYVIMATAAGGTKPAIALADEREARDVAAALDAARAVLTEDVSYEVVETVFRY